MIVVRDLVKNYGNFQAVKGLNLHVKEGQIVGLLGPNGAGKSTTMNIITGYISATSGSIEVAGCDIMSNPKEAKKKIGYLPEIPPLYMDMSVLSYLKFVAEIKGIKKKERIEEVKRVMKVTKITDRAQRIISKLSKGYRQRVGLAAALLGNPPILILDEPTVGLDPSQIIEIRDLIKSLAKEHTVILSSHILAEVSAVCDHIIIINNGCVVAEDTPENLSKMYSNQSHVYMEVKGDKAAIANVLNQIAYIDSYTFVEEKDEVWNITLVLNTEEDKDDELFFAFAEKKMPVRKVSHESLTLEEVFLKITEGDAQPVNAPNTVAEKVENMVQENELQTAEIQTENQNLDFREEVGNEMEQESEIAPEEEGENKEEESC